jgi:protein-disulfide isomerase
MLRHSMKALAACLMMGLGLVLGACSGGTPGNIPLTADEQKIGEAVRRYLMANPQVLDEVRSANVRRLAEGDPRDFSLGPAKAPVTIVEFMDYRCPYCHQAMDWVLTAAKAHPDKVRIIFIDFPVLGAASQEAAALVLAAAKQDKYLTLHQAFMRHQGPLTSDVMDAIARQAGVDVARLRQDMNDPVVRDHLGANFERAGKADFSATPSFLINGVPVQGFDKERLDSLLAEQLKAGG